MLTAHMSQGKVCQERVCMHVCIHVTMCAGIILGISYEKVFRNV